MEQFKKWESTHSPGEYAYQKWEDGWRAALKWVYKNHCKGSWSDGSDLEDDIKHELEGGD